MNIEHTNLRPQQTLTLNQSQGIECTNCTGILFTQVVLLRKFSKLLTGAPQDSIHMIPVLRCDDCGEVCKDMIPEGLPDIEAKLGLNKKQSVVFHD